MLSTTYTAGGRTLCVGGQRQLQRAQAQRQQHKQLHGEKCTIEVKCHKGRHDENNEVSVWKCEQKVPGFPSPAGTRLYYSNLPFRIDNKNIKSLSPSSLVHTPGFQAPSAATRRCLDSPAKQIQVR